VRGEVLSLRRPIGFLPGSRIDRFVVLQSDRLAAVLDTLLVVPLDRAHADYSRLPALVRVSAAEAGTKEDHVAIVPHLGSIPADRFDLSPVGRLQPATLARIARVVKLVLDVP
jgi:mRNA-degrading endonuclease toxin of MazEF toxin-antitoxin module